MSKSEKFTWQLQVCGEDLFIMQLYFVQSESTGLSYLRQSLKLLYFREIFLFMPAFLHILNLSCKVKQYYRQLLFN